MDEKELAPCVNCGVRYSQEVMRYHDPLCANCHHPREKEVVKAKRQGKES